jgi:phosphotransferase system  glucose/maltose/N-acetylglucosamine-specific IIC component
VPLATLQATAATQIDAAAEAARLLWITNGCGQSLEYNALEAETASATAAPDPLDPTVYPWLGTELAAQIAAGNTTMTLRQVAAMNAAQIAAWKAAGIAIRQTRRTAKLQIAAAPTAAAIDAIVAGVTWPAGPS